MRRLWTAKELAAKGVTRSRIKWQLRQGKATLLIRGVYGAGPEPASALDVARATAFATGGVMRRTNAAAAFDFDGVACGGPDVAVGHLCRSRLPGVHRVSRLPDAVLLHQVNVTPAAFTLLDLAGYVDDDRWEQALEFCLRKSYIAPYEVCEVADGSSESARRIRRVISARGGLDAPHTDSMLETLAIQLFRKQGLPTPVRQYRVINADGRSRFVDLCWPDLGVFLELDGQGHKDQPVYDAQRQNEITRLTGWRCVRLTWDQVVTNPAASARELLGILTMWMTNFSGA